MASPIESRIASLEQRLQALHSQLRGSPGVSTAGGGSLSIRTLQIGFPAKLTSRYNTSTGYSWKRTKLEPPTFANPTIQLTGDNAFEVTGDKSLKVGTSVWMEPSPDAVGYVFTVSGNASGDTADCVRKFLTLPPCATLSVLTGVGSCGCVPARSGIALTNTGGVLSSETPLYGCPPGVVTPICADDGLNTGAPNKWNIIVAGFTSPDTGFNGNYTLTHTTGEIWVATRGVVTLTATRTLTGWTLSLTDGSTTVTYDTTMAACCEAITFDLDDGGGSSDPPATLDMTPASACGRGSAYTASVSVVDDECGPCVKMVWTPVAGSGSRSITFKMLECGTDDDGGSYIEFASNDPLLCTDDAEECGENVVVVRVTCDVCPNPYWNGPGWYCVDGECQYLLISPATNYTITAGPFETEEECSCSPINMPGCEECVGPTVICAAFEVVTGPDPLGMGGKQFPLTWFNYPDPDVPGNAWYGWKSYDLPNDTGIGLGVGNIIASSQCNIFPFMKAGGYLYFPNDGTSIIYEEPQPEPLEWVNNLCDLTTILEAGTYVYYIGANGVIPDGTEYKVTFTAVDCPVIPLVTYNCVPGTGCVEVYDGSGKTLAECDAECADPNTTWDCVDGDCVPVAGSGGEFPTEAACIADGCEEPPPGACCGDYLPNGTTVNVNGNPTTWTVAAAGTTTAHTQPSVLAASFYYVKMVCLSSGFEMWGWFLEADANAGTEPPDVSYVPSEEICTGYRSLDLGTIGFVPPGVVFVWTNP